MPEYEEQKVRHLEDLALAAGTLPNIYHIRHPGTDNRADELCDAGVGSCVLTSDEANLRIKAKREFVTTEDFKWEYELVHLVELLEKHSEFDPRNINERSSIEIAADLKRVCVLLKQRFAPCSPLYPKDIYPWLKYIQKQIGRWREVSDLYELTDSPRIDEDAAYVRFKADCSMIARWIKACPGYAAFAKLKVAETELLECEKGSVVVIRRSNT